jgi:hypothetical protein
MPAVAMLGQNALQAAALNRFAPPTADTTPSHRHSLIPAATTEPIQIDMMMTTLDRHENDLSQDQGRLAKLWTMHREKVTGALSSVLQFASDTVDSGPFASVVFKTAIRAVKALEVR